MLFDKNDLVFIGITKEKFIQFSQKEPWRDCKGTISFDPVISNRIAGINTKFYDDLNVGDVVKTETNQTFEVFIINADIQIQVIYYGTVIAESDVRFKAKKDESNNYSKFIDKAFSTALLTIKQYLKTAGYEYKYFKDLKDKVLANMLITDDEQLELDLLEKAEIYLTAKEMCKVDKTFQDNGYNTEAGAGISYSIGNRPSIKQLNNDAMGFLRKLGCQVDTVFAEDLTNVQCREVFIK